MVKPSILQTLLRQPSQSYSSPTSDSSTYSTDLFPPSFSTTRSEGRASSIRSGRSSIRSSKSNGSVGWDWSVFGGRKGLTGGEGSLRAPSDIGGFGERDEERSLRSVKSLGSIREGRTSGKSKAGETLSGYSPSSNIGMETVEGATPRIRRRSEVGHTSARVDSERMEPSRRYSSFSSSEATGNSSIEVTASSPLQDLGFDDSTLTTMHEVSKKRKKKVKMTSLVSDSSVYDGVTTSSTSSSSGTITPISTPATSPDLSMRALKEDQTCDLNSEDEDSEESERKFSPLKLREGFRLASVEEEEAEADEEDNSEIRENTTCESIVHPADPVQPKDGEELEDIRPSSVYFDAIEALTNQLRLNRKSQDLSEKIQHSESEEDVGLRTGESEGETYFDMMASDSLGSLASLMTAPEESEIPNEGSFAIHDPLTPVAVSSNAAILLSYPTPTFILPPTEQISVPSAAVKTTSMELATGRTYTMDEFFATLPLVVQVSTSTPSKVSPSPTPTIQDSLPPANLPASTSAPSSVHSEASERGTGYSSPSTGLTTASSGLTSTGYNVFERERSKRKNATRILNAVSSTGSPESTKLRRSLSATPSSSTSKKTRSKPTGTSQLTRSASARMQLQSSLPSIEIVRSSSNPQLTSANLASSANHTAAQDTPEWLKKIRALGEPIVALESEGISRKGSRRSPKLSGLPENKTLEKLREEGSGSTRRRSIINSSLSRPTSMVSDSSTTGSPIILEREEGARKGSISMSRDSSMDTITSMAASSSGRISATGESTIPRRRTQSAGPVAASKTRSNFAPYPSFPSDLILASSIPLPTNDSKRISTFSMASQASYSDFHPPPPPAPLSIFSDGNSMGGQSAAGRTTMSVPTGAYRPAKNPRRFSTSVAQSTSTMSAISVTSNATAALGRRSSSMKLSMLFKNQSTTNVSTVPAHLAKTFDPRRDLTFGNLKPPRSKLKSDEVLVEVLAVGLDAWDFDLAEQKSSKPDGFGWIPGRAFCGRVIEGGYEVTKVKKGDFVFGVNDLKKSGALAELLVVNRDLITLAPDCGISVEQIASLPAAGILAVQAMETLCNELPRGSKILVLNAHEGVGNLCLQLAFYFRVTRDLWVVAQCLPKVTDGEDYCKKTGASEVIMDEPLPAINSLHESSFDVVIDTIGGRRLYDASRRILHFSGSYYTTVGDSLSSPTPSSHFKTSMRSLRRSFFKKDNKQISYWNLSMDERENRREALEKLRDAVEVGGVRGTVKRIFGFEEGREAFVNWEGEGRVVRILEA